ncbi:MAG: hypothetical protein GWM92_00695, partial [Gemmatimonadetes bacterium]|nr:hypothetical protein [Gemmatimonadota bacterium]NIR76967.1 hypothetical protein [Gemmatimonadota bacterium]NIT85494.1 hypothetical protein [Gemmatimonadota bacterium]NIU29318.1 hypothetical protein [Gemmatimonadota bacterium]NIU34388.1 hypothetical protein [Gemmatimonadota bacterium]
EVAEAIHEAFTMADDERSRRMERMRGRIRERDSEWWVEAFLGAARGEGPAEGSGPLETFTPRAPAGFF